MTGLPDIEQLIPLIKPLFDGLRSVRDFFRPGSKRKPAHALEIPKQTLIIMPEARANGLWWGIGTVASKPAMQIVGDFQATNTSPFSIQISGVHLLRPKMDVVMSVVTVANPKTGTHSGKNLIAQGTIGEFRMVLFVIPPISAETEIFSADLSFIDQFNNAHLLKDIRFRRVGTVGHS